MADFTQTFHRTAYGAISPTNPANSQAGRTVLISGASAGIGLSIAESYALASADTVILLGRRPHVLESAVTTIRDRLSEGSHCSLVTKVCDVSSAESVTACWDSLRDSHTSVDVMVLNVGETGPTRNTDDIIKHFEINVFANLRMLDRFQSQGPANGKVVLNISSGAAHGSPVRAPGRGAYGASKAAFASLLQSNADVVPASELQMINIHPGLIFTDAARQMGMDERSLPWDDGDVSQTRNCDYKPSH